MTGEDRIGLTHRCNHRASTTIEDRKALDEDAESIGNGRDGTRQVRSECTLRVKFGNPTTARNAA